MTHEHKQRFLKLKEAYDVLSDPKRKKIYDEYDCVVDETNYVLSNGVELVDNMEEQEKQYHAKPKCEELQVPEVIERHQSKTMPSETSRANTKQNLFSNFLEYSYYATTDSSSHMSSEEFKHIYHTLRYFVKLIFTDLLKFIIQRNFIAVAFRRCRKVSQSYNYSHFQTKSVISYVIHCAISI